MTPPRFLPGPARFLPGPAATAPADLEGWLLVVGAALLAVGWVYGLRRRLPAG